MWLLLFAQVAAAGLHAKPSRAPLPAREVERGLVLPKGWTEVGVDLARKVADERWTASGATEVAPARYARWTQVVRLRHGVAPGLELWVTVPWHQARLGSASVAGLGDAAFGARIGLGDREPPRRALALELAWESASATEVPIALGVGTPECEIALAGRAEIGALALSARGGYAARLPGPVRWLPGTIDPGDLVRGRLDARFQFGPFVALAQPTVTARGDTVVSGVRARDSGGIAVDVRVGGLVALTRAVEVGFDRAWPLIGQDAEFWTVDELHPMRGATWTAAWVVRF